MSDLFSKGSFVPIDKVFVKESLCALDALTEIQNKYKRMDMDTLLNEIHDSMVGDYLGFSLINTEKHVFDCKYSKSKDIFLESKVASYYAKELSATFNDTNLEKAEAFRSSRVWLSLSIWESVTKLLCICYGQNKEIGDFLKNKIINRKEGSRSTQSITLSSLIFRYNFKLLAVSCTQNELIAKLALHNRKFSELEVEDIQTLKTFKTLL
ncbi:MAG: hypothetical protein SOZ73_01805 [Campylobacter sp.]|nr:hypothetical protein [Campylobacter sp.]MDY3775946.1 hypothetical protein [Campylobacter sp.]